MTVTARNAEHAGYPPFDDEGISLEELARRQGVEPVRSLADMARPDVFESDREADEFVSWVAGREHGRR